MSYSFYLGAYKHPCLCFIHAYFLYVFYNLFLYDQNDYSKINSQIKDFGVNPCEVAMVGNIF
jgi:hypothetical protein